VSDHVASKAAFVAALPPEDPERVEAEAHARSCAACARALVEGQALVALLERAPAPPPSSVETLARVSAVIERETACDARTFAGAQPLLVTTAVLVAWALELGLAKKLVHDAASVAVSAGCALAATALATMAFTRARLAAAGAAIASLLLVLVAQGGNSGLYALLGIKCTLIELVAAAIPFGLAVAFARRAGAPMERWYASAIAAAGAVAGQAALYLSCKVPHAGAHLLVFHFGGVLLAGLLARGGAQVLRPRSA
jgi:hypothetical protein